MLLVESIPLIWKLCRPAVSRNIHLSVRFAQILVVLQSCAAFDSEELFELEYPIRERQLFHHNPCVLHKDVGWTESNVPKPQIPVRRFRKCFIDGLTCFSLMFTDCFSEFPNEASVPMSSFHLSGSSDSTSRIRWCGACSVILCLKAQLLGLRCEDIILVQSRSKN